MLDGVFLCAIAMDFIQLESKSKSDYFNLLDQLEPGTGKWFTHEKQSDIIPILQFGTCFQLVPGFRYTFVNIFRADR